MQSERTVYQRLISAHPRDYGRQQPVLTPWQFVKFYAVGLLSLV